MYNQTMRRLVYFMVRPSLIFGYSSFYSTNRKDVDLNSTWKISQKEACMYILFHDLKRRCALDRVLGPYYSNEWSHSLKPDIHPVLTLEIKFWQNSPLGWGTLKMHLSGVIFTHPERCLSSPNYKSFALIHKPYVFFLVARNHRHWVSQFFFCVQLSCSCPFTRCLLRITDQ